MKKKILSTIVCAFVVFGQIAVMAEPISDQLQSQQNQLKQDKNDLKDVQDHREELEAQIEELDTGIEDTYRKIDENKKQIAQAEVDIKNAQNDVKKTEEEVADSKELLGKRMSAMYKSGNKGYLSMILESTSIGDFISRIEWIKNVMDFDKKTIQALEEKEKELGKKKEALDQKKADQVALKSTNEQKLAALNDSMKEQSKLIEEVKKQEKTFASKVKESQTLVNTTMAQIQQIRNSIPKYDPSRGAVKISDNAVIAYAANFLGTTYVWGGTSPNPGFDCSGFTRYVYAHFGISLGRTTWDQINDGVPVSKSQLQPGDLLFYGKGGNPTHVGMYVGNGSYIHAPRTGDVVKISSIDRSDYITARRVK